MLSNLPLVILLSKLAISHAEHIPASLFGQPKNICPAGDQLYAVNGYPGTPHVSTPFQNEYIRP